MDELDDARLDGVGLFVLDDSFDALFTDGLIATVEEYGLVERPLPAARAAPAVAECGEDGDPSSDAERGECVLGPSRPLCASTRAKKRHLGVLSTFEAGLQWALMNNKKKCWRESSRRNTARSPPGCESHYAGNPEV
jgi:hypothetical protein